MKKIYKNYIIQKRQGPKYFILGINENHKAVKVKEALLEEEANNIRAFMQNKANIYYDLICNFQKTINNCKSRYHQLIIPPIDFAETVEQALYEYKAHYVKITALSKNIINKSIKSSHADSKSNI